MNKLYVGRVVGTHGIKGEIKVFSDNEYQERIFKVGTVFYFGDLEKEYKVSQIRYHKGNYLVLLDGFNNINDVLFLNKMNVYVDRDIVLNDNEYTFDDLIGFTVIYNEEEVGVIKDYQSNSSYTTFLVEGRKNFYLPNVEEYVVNIDLKDKKVYTKNVGELMI